MRIMCATTHEFENLTKKEQENSIRQIYEILDSNNNVS